MTKSLGAGDLYYKVAFLKREETDDGLGNVTGHKFVEQFACRAAYRHLRGGETVMAGRLQGKHAQVIIVRSSSQTRLVTTDWIVRDVRASTETEPGSGQFAGDVFNIRDVTQETDRMWITFLCEKGVAL